MARFWNLLTTPAELMADPELLARVAEVMADPDAYPPPSATGRPATSCSPRSTGRADTIVA